MFKRKHTAEVPPPEWVLNLERSLGDDPRIESVELKHQGTTEDRAIGDLIVHIPSHPSPLFIWWASVTSGARILFDKFIFEDFPSDGIPDLIDQILTDSIQVENKGRFFKASRLTVNLGDEQVASDWSSGWYRAG